METLLSTTISLRKLALPGGALAWLIALPATMDDAPLVLVQHGLGSRKERHLELCVRLAEAGFRACTVDAAFHGERRTNGPEEAALAGSRDAAAFPGAFAACVDRTVEDLSEFAQGLTDKPWALVGHSMGGFIALTAARRLENLTRIVVIAGAIEPEFAPERSPVQNAGELAPTQVLLLHGDADPLVPFAGAERLDAALLSSRLVAYPGGGHDLTGQMITDAVEWLQLP